MVVGSVLEPDPPDLGAGDLGSPLVAPCPLPSPAGPKEALPGYLQCEDKQEVLGRGVSMERRGGNSGCFLGLVLLQLKICIEWLLLAQAGAALRAEGLVASCP